MLDLTLDVVTLSESLEYSVGGEVLDVSQLDLAVLASASMTLGLSLSQLVLLFILKLKYGTPYCCGFSSILSSSQIAAIFQNLEFGIGGCLQALVKWMSSLVSAYDAV